MARFEFLCKECDISWEHEADVGKAPKETLCPACEELSPRYYGNQTLNISFKDDGARNHYSNAGDFHTVKRRYEKFDKEGFDKDSANRFLNKAIKDTTDRIVDTSNKYVPYHFDYESMAKKGTARRLNDTETAKKLETARKLTQEAYDKGGLDITQPMKQC